MPLYDKIVDEVMSKISAGKLCPGDQLPTEMEYAQQFNVSRPTVRAALQKLSVDGFIKRVKGSGTYVTKPRVVQESMIFIESYNREMRAKGLTPQTEVLELRKVPAEGVVSEKLEIPEGTYVVKLKRLRFAAPDFDDKPVLLTTAYIPFSVAPDLLEQDLENASLYDTLEKSGIVVDRVEREIEVRLLYGKNARMLDVDENSPAHFVTSVGYDSDGRKIEYAESYYPADRNKFIITIKR